MAFRLCWSYHKQRTLGAVNQEYQKRLRLRSTEQRIDLFNALYETCLKVHKAAQVVYYGQPVMVKQFELV